MATANSNRRPKNDISGLIFGRLGVIRPVGKRGSEWMFLCKCECGTIKPIGYYGIIYRTVVSCGCYSREKHTKHGRSETKEYHVWEAMLARCYNPNTERFPHYGGRGIQVCDRWRSGFVAFFADMGPCPKGQSLDRIDNDGNYSPENCRWTDSESQQRNRSTCALLTFNGVTKTLTEWSNEKAIAMSTINNRLKAGWTVERALATPPGRNNFKRHG